MIVVIVNERTLFVCLRLRVFHASQSIASFLKASQSFQPHAACAFARSSSSRSHFATAAKISTCSRSRSKAKARRRSSSFALSRVRCFASFFFFAFLAPDAFGTTRGGVEGGAVDCFALLEGFLVGETFFPDDEG